MEYFCPLIRFMFFSFQRKCVVFKNISRIIYCLKKDPCRLLSKKTAVLITKHTCSCLETCRVCSVIPIRPVAPRPFTSVLFHHPISQTSCNHDLASDNPCTRSHTPPGHRTNAQWIELQCTVTASSSSTKPATSSSDAIGWCQASNHGLTRNTEEQLVRGIRPGIQSSSSGRLTVTLSSVRFQSGVRRGCS